MKKKMLLITVLAALLAVPVFAATTDQGRSQNWWNGMYTNHQQMIQQAVNDGTITKDEAATVNESMGKIAPIMQKIMNHYGGRRGHGMMWNNDRNGNCYNNGVNDSTQNNNK